MTDYNELQKKLEKYFDNSIINDEIDTDNGESNGKLKELMICDGLRMDYVKLLNLVIDKSYSMHTNGLEKEVEEKLTIINDLLQSNWWQAKNIQISETLFGSTLEIYPYEYKDNINISYKAIECKTRLYDAIVESSRNIINRYNVIRAIGKCEGYILVLSDCEDTDSLYTDLAKCIEEVRYNNIQFGVVSFKDMDLEKVQKHLRSHIIEIENGQNLRHFLRFFSERII